MQTKRCFVYFGFLLVVIVACCQAQSLLKTFKGTTRPPSIDDALKLKSANNTLTNSNKNTNKGNQKPSGKLAKNSNNANNVNNDNDDDDDDNDDNNNGENEAVANKKKPNSKQNTKPSSKGSKNQKQKESKQAAKKLPADDDDNEDEDNGKDKDDDDDDNDDSSTTTEATTTTSSNDDDNDNDNDNNNENENCTAPSINDFPSDLFTQTQRRFGAVLLHVAFAAYLFLAIMVVCDDYFMTSLEIIGQNLNLDQDVAGATFMAAGSSAPEVFISLVGIIVGESNPGIGAIVGSAIFNILFVVGLCGLFVLGTAKLTMWPFFRDAVFYCAAILLLVLLIRDDKVYWYESFVLLAFYGVYIFFMMNNDRFKNMAYEKFKILQQEAQSILPGGLSTTGAAAPHNKQFGFLTARRSISKSQSGYNRFNDDDEMYAWGGTLDNIAGHANIDNFSYQNSAGGGGVPQQQTGTNKQGIDMNMLLNADSLVASNTRQIDFDTAALQIMLSSRYYFRPKTRFRMAVRRVIDEILWIKRTSTKKTQVNMNNFDLNPLNKQNYALFLTDVPNINEPGGRVNFAKWAVMVPARILFYFTMPDCRVEKYKKWYILTFCVSILWLAVLSYLIIWMITVIGYTLGIPDSLMAVTLIAAGTSIPDAYTSVVVVKEGMVDMGVSNIIGSNVFDLLIGLALPWFIKSIFNNGYVIINSNGLVYDSLLLYACVFATICVIHVRKWNLDRRTGYLFLSIYSAFIIFSSAIELNVFSYVNPPMCS